MKTVITTPRVIEFRVNPRDAKRCSGTPPSSSLFRWTKFSDATAPLVKDLADAVAKEKKRAELTGRKPLFEFRYKPQA